MQVTNEVHFITINFTKIVPSTYDQIYTKEHILFELPTQTVKIFLNKVCHCASVAQVHVHTFNYDCMYVFLHVPSFKTFVIFDIDPFIVSNNKMSAILVQYLDRIETIFSRKTVLGSLIKVKP